jgi:hypothetical protein
MTALATRAHPARPYLAPPTLLERTLLAAARALEASAHRRMASRQQQAQRILDGFDPLEQRRAHIVEAYRRR